MTKATDMISRMGAQICKSVQWDQCVRKAMDMGMQSFIEIGPKPVLSSLVKTISSEINVLYVFWKLCDQ